MCLQQRQQTRRRIKTPNQRISTQKPTNTVLTALKSKSLPLHTTQFLFYKTQERIFLVYKTSLSTEKTRTVEPHSSQI